MYLIVENLRLYLESDEIRLASGAIAPLFLGRRFAEDGDMNRIFNSGGSGYTLKKEALKVLVESFPSCFPTLFSSAEDVYVASCLRDEGIFPYDTKDSKGGERYMPFTPEGHMLEPDGWYAKYCIDCKVGIDHVASRPIAFHYVDPDLMKRMHAVLYGYCNTQEVKIDSNDDAGEHAPIADYEYFPEIGREQSVEEPVFQRDQRKCSLIARVIDTSPPKNRPPSIGACDGFDGVLLIRQGDAGGASGTIFFLFVLGMLQYADQFNLKPWVHLNSFSRVVYDPVVHHSQMNKKFIMMEGMTISWARDAQDDEGNLFPGRPRLIRDQLQPKEFLVKGTGVWNHYFLPVR